MDDHFTESAKHCWQT